MTNARLPVNDPIIDPASDIAHARAHDPTHRSPVLALDDVSFVRSGNVILDQVTLHVHADERWLVLGANGSGKTTLLRIAAMYEHPSAGTVTVLGEQLGRTDVRVLRRSIGYSSQALAAEFRPALDARDVVMTARYAALEPWWHRYTDADRARADECLDRLHVGHLADRTFGTLSTGERQRVLLARTLMNDPGVILLDEPSGGLDLAGREELVHALDELAGSATHAAGPPFVLVTHHVDEVPSTVTHVLLLRHGRAVARGPISTELTSETLSECFGLPLALERRPDGRFSAWSRRPDRRDRPPGGPDATGRP